MLELSWTFSESTVVFSETKSQGEDALYLSFGVVVASLILLVMAAKTSWDCASQVQTVVTLGSWLHLQLSLAECSLNFLR